MPPQHNIELQSVLSVRRGIVDIILPPHCANACTGLLTGHPYRGWTSALFKECESVTE